MNIAIVEDEKTYSDTVKEYLLRFAEENAAVFDIAVFDNAISLLTNYSGKYDVILLDIKMPYINGMDAARRLRELDEKVILIFITSLAQYAVKGYEVNALDYILKPVTYGEFAIKFMRAYKKLKKKENSFIVVPTERGMAKLDPEDIAYCEVIGHNITFHTVGGDYRQYITLKAVEKKLEGLPFVRCNNCFLVNLRYCTELDGDIAVVRCGQNEHRLAMSRNRRKAFSESLKRFLSGELRGGG